MGPLNESTICLLKRIERQAADVARSYGEQATLFQATNAGLVALADWRDPRPGCYPFSLTDTARAHLRSRGMKPVAAPSYFGDLQMADGSGAVALHVAADGTLAVFS